MTLKPMLAGMMLLVTAACGVTADGPPEITVDRTACSHCGMLISEPLYAAAYRAPEAEGRVFDDIGCLLAAARGEAGTGLRFWFHDASGGGWIDGAEASFVTSAEIRTPMGGGLIAYRDPAAAADAARRLHGEVVGPLDALLTRKGGTR